MSASDDLEFELGFISAGPRPLMTPPAADAPLTMSSREIAELVKSRHDSVKRSIERLGLMGLVSFTPSVEKVETGGRPAIEYLVGKRDSYVIVAQLSPEFTAALVDRWQELEQAQAPKLPQTYAQALIEAGRLALQVEAQAAQLAQAAPAVEFMGKYVEASGLMGLRQVCKLLGANEARFGEFLRSAGIMYRLADKWAPYAQHTDAGRFAVRTGVALSNGHAFTSAKFTPKGVQWVAGEWAKHQLKAGS